MIVVCAYGMRGRVERLSLNAEKEEELEQKLNSCGKSD
jgi:hypothetical protein